MSKYKNKEKISTQKVEILTFQKWGYAQFDVQVHSLSISFGLSAFNVRRPCIVRHRPRNTRTPII